MAIKMQGTWLVRVKAKNASFPQEFIIAGANSGNGTYPHTHSGEVFVTGSSWTISMLHNPGAGFQNSQMKLKFPTTSGGFRQFDIQSNDSGNDQDFDDFIITCRTPIVADDHIVYGHVSDYSGRCIFNPCFPYWVIDTPRKLYEALQIPSLRKYLLELDPNILRRIPKPGPPDPIGPVALNPQPLPPLKFVPITVPAPGELASPLKQSYLVRTEKKVLDLAANAGTKQAKAATDAEKLTYQSVKSIQALPASASMLDVSALKRKAGLETAISRFRFCDSDTLANVRIRFWEYDRTAAEKSGAAYTGEGARQYLGSTLTDDFGNYIFRFTTTSSDAVDEIVNDLANGENAFVAQAPDVIAEVMQPMNPYLPAFETSVYWNIPALKAINICVPREKIGVRPLVCEGQHILQGVGNIPLGAPVGGVRNSTNTSLSALGIITSTNSLGPRTDCSAWAGTLLLRGCLKNQAIKYYTLEHRRPGDDWQQLNVEFTLPRFYGAILSNGQVNQGVVGGKTIYLNVEADGSDWLMAYRNIKAQIPSTIFPENGPRDIRITGLNAAYNAVAGAQEIITLFILNNGIDVDIQPEIEMIGVSKISECGLFNLPAGQENPKIRINFKAVQSSSPWVYGGYGFMSDYAVSMNKGASGFATTNPASPANPRTAGVCDLSFTGTNNEPGNVAGYVDLELSPASGAWLEPNQSFCTFGIFLNGRLRRTDGQSNEGYTSAVPVLFGIQR